MNRIEPLNKKSIEAVLNVDSKSNLTQLTIHPSISSTNDYLLDFAKKNSHIKSGVVCVADEQTKGRGRQGKEWYSPKGANIYFSLLWYFPAEIDLSQLSLAIAIMIVNALEHYGVEHGLQLKWPNDIYFNGKKLAGVLIESLPVKDQMIAVVIGVGLNLQLPPNNPFKQGSIDLAEILGQIPKRNELIGHLMQEMLLKLPVYAQLGFSPFFQAWPRYDFLRNKKISINVANASITGVMQGVNEAGELILCCENGALKTFRCGEVSVKV